MNEQRKWGIYIQFNIIQPLKKKKYCHVQISGYERHYNKLNKPDTKEQTLHDPIFMKNLKQ